MAVIRKCQTKKWLTNKLGVMRKGGTSNSVCDTVYQNKRNLDQNRISHVFETVSYDCNVFLLLIQIGQTGPFRPTFVHVKKLIQSFQIRPPLYEWY